MCAVLPMSRNMDMFHAFHKERNLNFKENRDLRSAHGPRLKTNRYYKNEKERWLKNSKVQCLTISNNCFRKESRPVYNVI